jgi:hypothetical protein
LLVVLVQIKVVQPVPSETVVVLDIMQVQVVVVTTVGDLDMAAAAAAVVQVLQITKPQASLKLKGLNQEMVLLQFLGTV